jgi:hypothetical protein
MSRFGCVSPREKDSPEPIGQEPVWTQRLTLPGIEPRSSSPSSVTPRVKQQMLEFERMDAIGVETLAAWQQAHH